MLLTDWMIEGFNYWISFEIHRLELNRTKLLSSLNHSSSNLLFLFFAFKSKTHANFNLWLSDEHLSTWSSTALTWILNLSPTTWSEFINECIDGKHVRSSGLVLFLNERIQVFWWKYWRLCVSSSNFVCESHRRM